MAGTKYELMAKNEVSRLRGARTSAVEAAFAELEARAKALNNPEDAAGVFAQYAGVFAAELADRRAEAETRYRTLAREAAEKLSMAEREAKTKEQETITAVAEAILKSDLAGARKVCQAFIDDSALSVDKADMKRIAGWLEQAAGADKALLASFEAQKGKDVVLIAGGTKVPIRVTGVKGDRVLIEQRKGVGWASAELALTQIPLDERKTRVGDSLDPAAAGIWNGIAFLRAKRPDLAAEAFKPTGELATLLLARTETAKADEREAAAQTAFAQVLKTVGLSAEGLDAAAVAERVMPSRVNVAQATLALRQLDAYAAAFADTQHAKAGEPVLAVLRTALEEARKGIAPVIPVAPAKPPKLDDFTKRILAARAHTGEVIRCSPAGEGGLPSFNDAVKMLKRGSVLVMTEGAYRDLNPISTHEVFLQSEGNVELASGRLLTSA